MMKLERLKISLVTMLLLAAMVYAAVPIYAADLVLENKTINSGQTVVEAASDYIKAGPNYVIQSGADVYFKAGRGIRLNAGFRVQDGSKFRVNVFGTDTDAPVVLSAYPVNDSLVPTQGASELPMILTFGDAVVGVMSVRLYDSNGEDITDQAIITANTLEYTITDPVEGKYQFSLELEDYLQNSVSIPIAFNVDTSIPVTTPSIAGGSFPAGEMFIALNCSEDATIYYSKDGYPPFVGAENTTRAGAPAQVVLEETTHLQFFAIDPSGNVETTKSEIYLVGEVPGDKVNPEARYNTDENRVEISWSSLPYPAKYRVYRCNNKVDYEILVASRRGGYPPPKKLELTTSELSATQYFDNQITQCAQYWYGVTVVHQAREGVISSLLPMDIPVTAAAQTKDDAIERAFAWLQKTQHAQGYWGNIANTRLLATTQVLNAYKLTGQDNAGLRQALFYVKGQFADNNDYLSRQIITLNHYGLNVDSLVNRLVSQAYINNLYIHGHGLQRRFNWDAIDTALGFNAIQCALDSATNIAGDQLRNFGWNRLNSISALQSAEAGKFGWVSGQETSIFVSSYVFRTILNRGTLNHDLQWILDSQNADGSFGNNVIDTAAVVLWLDMAEPGRSNAINYLVAHQDTMGSWMNDPYITGICLEALMTSN